MPDNSCALPTASQAFGLRDQHCFDFNAVHHNSRWTASLNETVYKCRHRDHLRQTNPPPLPRLSRRQLQAPHPQHSTVHQHEDDTKACTAKQQSNNGCPVFVMLPLDSVAILRCEGGTLSEVQSLEALELALDKIARAKVQVCIPHHVPESLASL